ncbi:DUF3298 domain-containing protein [Rhizobium sp. CRIBSB]|nr:DUF3298 domain-containing protein [Rhizobium sp. CRIBSB]
MFKTTVRLLMITTALFAVAACNREKAEMQGESPPATGAVVPGKPADAAAPMDFSQKTEFATVALTLPEAVKAQPDLHARLYSDEVRKLRQFVEGAQSDRTEAGGEGLPAYEKTVTVTTALETGRLLSLKRTDFDFSGGAHPNTLFTSVLWDKALKQQLTPLRLFRTGADMSSLDNALCAAINAAKRARVPDSDTVVLGGKDWACPLAMETPFVLAPGNLGGKAGGLVFLIGAYQVGPYAEGAYEISVPQAVFRSLLAPAYADEFGGAPLKVGDVTPG